MKRLDSIFVLTKLKESKIRIFSILDFQRIFGIDYESAKRQFLVMLKKEFLPSLERDCTL
jgi:hypothetical protein